MATGILLFLLWDVLAASVEEVEGRLTAGDDARFFGLATLLTVGFGVGLLSLAGYDAWLSRRRKEAKLGPGAASIAEYQIERHLVSMSHRSGSRSSSRRESGSTTSRRAWRSASPRPRES